MLLLFALCNFTSNPKEFYLDFGEFDWRSTVRFIVGSNATFTHLPTTLGFKMFMLTNNNKLVEIIFLLLKYIFYKLLFWKLSKLPGISYATLLPIKPVVHRQNKVWCFFVCVCVGFFVFIQFGNGARKVSLLYCLWQAT